MQKQFIRYLRNHLKIDFSYYARGGFWLLCAQIITITGGLILSVILSNSLPESQYGIYRYLIGIGTLLTTFSLTGVTQSILQTAAKQYFGFYSIGVKTSRLYSLGISVAGSAGALYYFLQDDLMLSLGCLTIAVVQPLINSFQNIFFLLQGSRQFKESTTVQGVKTSIVVGSVLSTLFFTEHVVALFAAFLISQAGVNYIAHRYFRPTNAPEIDQDTTERYLSFARHSSLRNIISGTAFRLDTIIIFQQLGAVELAVYAIANMVPEQIKGGFKNLASLIIPKYAQHDNLASIKRSMLWRSVQLGVLFSIISAAYIATIPFVYELLFPKYHEAIWLSQIIALSFPAAVAIIPFSALQSQLADRVLHTYNILSSFILLVLTLSLITSYGLVGAVAAKVASRYINTALAYYFVYRN